MNEDADKDIDEDVNEDADRDVDKDVNEDVDKDVDAEWSRESTLDWGEPGFLGDSGHGEGEGSGQRLLTPSTAVIVLLSDPMPGRPG